MQYKPCKATIVSAGMQCTFELAAFFDTAGEYDGEIHFTDKDGHGTFAVCPVYIRVLDDTAIGLLAYVVGTILLWAPWTTGQNQVSESKVYLQITKHAPAAIAQLRIQVEKALANPRL